MTLVLASMSARRRELLSRLGVTFEVIPSSGEERPPRRDEAPEEYASELARDKARVVSAGQPDAVILAADTVVAVDHCLLGKPEYPAEARRMLELLRGRAHVVVTGVAVRSQGVEHWGRVVSTVHMRAYSDADIAAYIATGEPDDKAGAYAIQGIGGSLVHSVDGCLEAVIGLPLCLSTTLLSRCLANVSSTDEHCHHLSGEKRFALKNSSRNWG